MATFTYPTTTASYNGGQPAVGRDVRDDLDEVRTFVVGKNLEGSNIADDTITEAHLVAAVLERIFSPGMMLPYGSATAPTGWLICDGQAVSTTTFAALFAIIGFSFAGDPGGGNFNLPDFRARAPIGLNDAGTPNGVNGSFTARALGAVAGDETKTLTTANLASHIHAIGSHVHSIGSHVHGIAALGLLGAGPTPFDGGGTMTTLYGGDDTSAVNFLSGQPSADDTGTSSGDTAATGSGTAFDVINPISTANYIIKT